MLEIFDAFGNVRTDLDSLTAAIEALDDVRREKLFAVVTANSAKREAEENLGRARRIVRERQDEYHKTLSVHTQYSSPVSAKPGTPDYFNKLAAAREGARCQAARDVIDAQSGRAKSLAAPDLKALRQRVAELEKRAKANRDQPQIAADLIEARKVLGIAELPSKVIAANNALAVAQADIVVASRALKDAERANNTAIADWLSANVERTSHRDLVDGMARATAETARAANAKAPTGPKVWPKDQVLKARGAERSKRTYFGPL